jgi:hypothetical protein
MKFASATPKRRDDSFPILRSDPLLHFRLQPADCPQGNVHERTINVRNSASARIDSGFGRL